MHKHRRNYFCNEIVTIFCRFWPTEIWFCLLFELKTTTKKFMHRPTVAWLLTHLAKFNQEMSTYEQVQQSIFFTHLFLTENLDGGNFCLFDKDNVITRLNLQLNTKTVSKKPHKTNDPSREDAFFWMKGAFVENVFMRTLVVFFYPSVIT